MLWLKQSTAVTVQFGPFLDAGDGVTLETGLATNMDNASTGIRVSKNGAAYADRNSATAPAYDAMGDYRIELSTTDTNTLGTLKIIFEEAATCLPGWAEYMVVPANVWDSLFGADVLNVDVTQWLGTAVATPTTAGLPEVDVTALAGGAQSLTDLKDFADAGYDPTTNKVQGVVLVDTTTDLTNLPTIPANWLTAAGINTGAFTAPKFAADAIDAAALSTDAVNEIMADWLDGGRLDLLLDAVKVVTDGQAADGSGLTTMPWNAAWDAEIESEVNDALDTAIPGVPTANSINQRIKALDELTEAAGAGDLAAILGDTDELQIDWVNGGRLDLILDIIAADTTTDIPALIAALENISEANVLTQVNAALDTNIPELGVGVPSATPTLRTGLQFLYMGVRNKRDTTSSSDEIHNNAGTVIASAVLSDDTVTYISGEYS